MYNLYCIDVDNTLVRPVEGKVFRKTPDDWEWLPGRQEKLAQLEKEGAQIALVTNQGGVGVGIFEEDAMEVELRKLQICGAVLYVCYAHPKSVSYYYNNEMVLFNRKPFPGMLFQAMLNARVTVLETVMIGDLPEDRQVAENAGVAFIHANEFFKDGVDDKTLVL